MFRMYAVHIVSKWTGIPVTALGRDDRKRLLDLTRCCARGQASPTPTSRPAPSSSSAHGRRRQDRARQGPRRGAFRQREGVPPHRHVRVHRRKLRHEPHRLASRVYMFTNISRHAPVLARKSNSKKFPYITPKSDLGEK
ncbi:hypothetical protein SEVIR_9G133183v4 [Setaria viridis]